MNDFKETINSKLKTVHSSASLQLFKQISNYVETSIAQSFSLKEEERLQHLLGVMLRVNSFLNTEINNENVRSVIRENLIKDYEVFLNPPPTQEESPIKKNEEDNTNQEIE